MKYLLLSLCFCLLTAGCVYQSPYENKSWKEIEKSSKDEIKQYENERLKEQNK